MAGHQAVRADAHRATLERLLDDPFEGFEVRTLQDQAQGEIRGDASELDRFPYGTASRAAHQRWSGLPPDSNAWDVVPDWMVEIICPSNSADEVIDKVDEYFRAGTRLVWVIQRNAQRVYVYTSPTEVTVYEAADELTADPVLPSFRFTAKAIFDGIAVAAERTS